MSPGLLDSSNQRCAAFLEAAVSSAGETFVPVLLDLLTHGCCPRCCLRFAGARATNSGQSYEHPAPSSKEFSAYLADRASSFRSSEGQIEAVVLGSAYSESSHLSPAPLGSSQSISRALDQAKTSAETKTTTAIWSDLPDEWHGSKQGSKAEQSPCCVCLGVLQAPESSAGTAPEELLEQVPDMPGSGAPWYRPEGSLVSALASTIRWVSSRRWN